jgi:hypothetical protein
MRIPVHVEFLPCAILLGLGLGALARDRSGAGAPARLGHHPERSHLCAGRIGNWNPPRLELR